LKKYRVEVVYLTKDSYEAKKKQIQETAKNPKPTENSARRSGDLFKGMFGGTMASDSKNSVKLYVKDPDKRVIDVEFQDASGQCAQDREQLVNGRVAPDRIQVGAATGYSTPDSFGNTRSTANVRVQSENVPLP